MAKQCSSCDGTGEATCSKCQGAGVIDYWDEDGNLDSKDCPGCGGRGRRGKCGKCRGTGVEPGSK
jgi:DnaJ-class molecular chaperone